ncbi:hypothetical protein CDAR_413551 [Caerostris darwini]|uniref:Uncharacterized protein n=1 Tax=Caerostris darwini TaxID=1538125 RepID=A0AAV4TBA8_9ARAC|nr:hypothetical protein CDAR_413551 [Caerostris darwini]
MRDTRLWWDTVVLLKTKINEYGRWQCADRDASTGQNRIVTNFEIALQTITVPSFMDSNPPIRSSIVYDLLLSIANAIFSQVGKLTRNLNETRANSILALVMVEC